jgi:uncharacterized protein (DUF433 family)
MAKADIYGGKDPRDLPAYTVPIAARIVRLPATTLRSWVRGRSYPTKTGTRRAAAVIIPPTPEFLSFTNLVEAHVLAAMRREHALKLETVRAAVRFLRKESGQEHPLAYEQFLTDRVDLFVERVGQLINVSRGGQLALCSTIRESLKRVAYDKGRAVRLFPVVRAERRTVVVDPRISFGRPVLDGTSIPVDAIADRFKAGESIAHLAHDFAVSTDLVEDAVAAVMEDRVEAA